MQNLKQDYQSPQSLVLRFMREKRKLTLFFVGKKIGIKPKTVDHIEHGRNIISKDELDKFLDCYDFPLEIFEEMMELNPLNKQSANLFFLARKIF
jgi:transcriptional regulator with XRE-family HTH domain